MNPPPPSRGWKSWVLSGLVAAGLLGGLGALLQLSKPQTAARAKSAAAANVADVGFARLDRETQGSLLDLEAKFRDPTPLFLPTEQNTTEDSLSGRISRDAGRSFPGFVPKLKFGEADATLDYPPSVSIPAQPSDAFASDRAGRPLIGFGQSDAGVGVLARRGAFIEVTTAGSGERVWAEAREDARPPAGADWQPLEFLIAVNRVGVVQPPLLTESSQEPSVDAYFQEYLLRGVSIGAKLRPGFYRICIGP